MPLDTFNTTDKVNDKFDNLFKKAEKGVISDSKNDTNNNINSGLLASFIVIIYCILFTYLKDLKGKEKYGIAKLKIPSKRLKSIKNIDYYRDIPCNNDIYRAFWIATQYGLIKDKSNLMGAVLLKWVKDEKIKIVDMQEGIIIKRDSYAIDFSNSFQCDNTIEDNLKKVLIEASKDWILESNELKKWAKKYYYKITGWYDGIIWKVNHSLEEEGSIVVKKRKLFGFITISIKKVVLPNIKEEAEQLLGLKKYLLDYSMIGQREVIETKLWKEYLVYAQLLGIADKVEKQFKKIYPTYESIVNMNTEKLIAINTISYIGVYSATKSYKKSARASSYSSDRSSGGGGHSSSGGGSDARGSSSGGGRR